MKYWIEIEYTNKQNESVHSDFGHVPKEEISDLVYELFLEIVNKADLSKPWSIHSNGEDK